MNSIDLSSILGSESFGEHLTSRVVKQIRISGRESSFSSSFNSDFAIGSPFKLDKVAAAIVVGRIFRGHNGSILSLEEFGKLVFPYEMLLFGISSKERLGLHVFDYLYVYSIGTVLYIVEEAKHRRLEKVAIKKVIVQKMASISSIAGYTVQRSPYKVWSGSLYSIIYEDTLGRHWEEQELTKDPESFFSWFERESLKAAPTQKKVNEPVSISSLGKRKKNTDWSKAKLFSKKMAEQGVFQRVNIKKVRTKGKDMLIYLDDKDTLWEQSELVFETMAAMLVQKFKSEIEGPR